MESLNTSLTIPVRTSLWNVISDNILCCDLSSSRTAWSMPNIGHTDIIRLIFQVLFQNAPILPGSDRLWFLCAERPLVILVYEKPLYYFIRTLPRNCAPCQFTTRNAFYRRLGMMKNIHFLKSPQIYTVSLISVINCIFQINIIIASLQ